MIQEERVRTLNDAEPRKGRYVLYWMQASQRAACNHALEYAIDRANDAGLPLIVYFGLTDRYPNANARHYAFLLEGLREVGESLAGRGIKLVVRRASPEKGAIELAEGAALAVVDRGYLRHQKRWRGAAARTMACPLIQVESDTIVPVETASTKEEYAAATIRAKIHRQLDRFLVPVKERRIARESLGLRVKGFDISGGARILARLDVARRVGPVETFRGGTSEARKRLRRFVKERLDRYGEDRNDPCIDGQSDLSPYLHFGQIAALEIALAVQAARGKGAEAYLEELIVRRELSMNLVQYNPHYDSLEALPAWVHRTLVEHAGDPRDVVYDLKAFEGARTHDPYWNAAQTEMVLTGKMHGYMRMYWGKKMLEWSPTAEHALAWAIHLNDKYELDGRDPNGYAGILWCFGKHDRPWGRRKVFGAIRYMNDKGLRRKFDADAYVEKIERLAAGR
ncbi:MAG: deoxyribodipyrimidine photo-lyase [Planctomycetes bacterium]|nr:deoxyribodipyrimidine photo-lyase [Planctomycetota bacterium]